MDNPPTQRPHTQRDSQPETEPIAKSSLTIRPTHLLPKTVSQKPCVLAEGLARPQSHAGSKPHPDLAIHHKPHSAALAGIARNRTKTALHSTQKPETSFRALMPTKRQRGAITLAKTPFIDPGPPSQPPCGGSNCQFTPLRSPGRHSPQSNKNPPPFNAKIKNVQSMHPPCQIARKGHLRSILPHP